MIDTAASAAAGNKPAALTSAGGCQLTAGTSGHGLPIDDQNGGGLS